MHTRLEKLSALAREKGCGGILITEEENLCYATGFVGLEGMVFVTAAGEGFCFTDSRYIEAAQQEIAPLGYQIIQPSESYPQRAEMLCRDKGLHVETGEFGAYMQVESLNDGPVTLIVDTDNL